MIDYFKQFDLEENSGGWWRFHNPSDFAHTDKTMTVNFDYMWVKDFRSGYSVSALRFVMDYEDCDFKTALRLLNLSAVPKVKNYKIKRGLRENMTYPDGFKPLISEQDILTERLYKYIVGRGMSVRALNSKGFGYGTKGRWLGYIIIPIFDGGILVGYFGRDFLGNKPKYLNLKGFDMSAVLYNQDILLQRKKVTLFEGWSDAEVWGESVACMGKSLSDVQVTKLRGCDEITIIADKGAYKEHLLNALKLVEWCKVRVISLDAFEQGDVNEIYVSWGLDKLRRIVERTEWMSMADLMSEI